MFKGFNIVCIFISKSMLVWAGTRKQKEIYACFLLNWKKEGCRRKKMGECSIILLFMSAKNCGEKSDRKVS